MKKDELISNMEYFAIGKKEKMTNGHGDSSDEIHICPKNSWNNKDFHPLFKSRAEAYEYINNLEFAYNLCPVKLFVNE